jgi:hypothetical protein
MKRDFDATNLLRTEDTRNISNARLGAQLILESIAFAYAPGAVWRPRTQHSGILPPSNSVLFAGYPES